jgi:hypothetical protein
MIACSTSSQIEVACEDQRLDDPQAQTFSQLTTQGYASRQLSCKHCEWWRYHARDVRTGILSQGPLMHMLAAATLSSE